MFSEPENTACFTCKHVLEDKQPILYVTHDNDDGSWQFLCGVDSHEVQDARVVGLIEIVNMDETLNDVYELKMRYGVYRKSKGESWESFKISNKD